MATVQRRYEVRSRESSEPREGEMNGRIQPRRGASRAPVWRPPTDVFVTDDLIVVRVEIAGMRTEEFSILLGERRLTIRGARVETPTLRRAFQQMEIRFGEFQADVELHWPISKDKIEAEYRAGFLYVNLPIEKPTQVIIQE